MSNASDSLEFLTNKFTNVDLYDWMSSVLERIYEYLLQQATEMERLAENQRAFERQQLPASYIQPDYWAPPGDIQGSASSVPDRKGLTGAERLLQDLTRLDQFAFLSDRRELSLTKTLSMARLAPAEFQRFWETGVMRLATPMELFDRDFSGHFLRLIKRVRNVGDCTQPAKSGNH